MTLTESFTRWTELYEQRLAELCSESWGAPTRKQIRAAEESADAEVKTLFAQIETLSALPYKDA